MRALIDVLSTQDDNVFARNIAILRIFELIAKHTPSCSRHIEHAPNNTEELKALIAWTHQNYGQKITLDSAAAVVGFSKHYFCKWFKARTGINYIQYVKRVRIYNASKFLLIGRSVSEASYDCGFENLSYFIRCFKEIHGCTPKEYAHCILNCGAPSENI